MRQYRKGIPRIQQTSVEHVLVTDKGPPGSCIIVLSNATAMSLKGKVALITGCTGGIGSATALSLARQGASIAVHYGTASEKANALVEQLKAAQEGVHAAIFQADLSDFDSVRRLHEQVVEQLGHPDILFNNAGATGKIIGKMGDIQDANIDEFERIWRLNTASSYLLTQLCIPHMVEQKYGRIVFCSSVAAGTGGVIGPHYASSKSALHGLLHWVASRYAKDGITCNAVAPALIIETGMVANPTEEMKNMIPVGRLGVPNEIASIVELLVTNAYMTNKIVVADGGWTAGAF
ncbi:3-ketoacyl-acyl carrier protein reductase [Moniliophthora roreri MCA 2997]|uniref:3-ketoacyl-acyl carrier protein reductase n=1 Tax=Moniliophthora roreri (strain MCA 2997) TaxID=1381753 RepID=V2XNS0_MONRO|nr:3-ketoacyl-acyl carrier protein reductase [Moniliophthora roreri MCA 2997]